MISKGRKIQLIPIGNRCLVKRYKEEETQGGIYIPEESKTASLLGEVVAVGEQCEYVSTGEQVYFGRYSGKEVSVDLDSATQQDYKDVLIMTDEDIICRVRELN